MGGGDNFVRLDRKRTRVHLVTFSPLTRPVWFVACDRVRVAFVVTYTPTQLNVPAKVPPPHHPHSRLYVHVCIHLPTAFQIRLLIHSLHVLR